MKYFLVVVLIALGALAFLQISKTQKTSASNVFEEFPYPSVSKLVNEGIRPALEKGSVEEMQKFTVSSAQSDVAAFMQAYSSAAGNVSMDNVDLIDVPSEDENVSTLQVIAGDGSGGTVFQGTLEISNPEHNLRYRIISASVNE